MGAGMRPARTLNREEPARDLDLNCLRGPASGSRSETQRDNRGLPKLRRGHIPSCTRAGTTIRSPAEPV